MLFRCLFGTLECGFVCGLREIDVDVTVLGLVGGAPGGETPRVADSSAAGAGRSFHNSVLPLAAPACGCEERASALERSDQAKFKETPRRTPLT